MLLGAQVGPRSLWRISYEFVDVADVNGVAH